MRGKAPSNVDVPGTYGITPAYAGKSAGRSAGGRRCRDHPRVCGEKRPAVDGKRPLRGSPPHVRGKVKDPVPVSALVGITPACAGKRSAARASAEAARDHPRVCGEKLMYAALLKYRRGSPPRVRGKVMRCSICQRGSGITPACAGKSEKTGWTTMCRRDHPRMCGEKRVRRSDSRRSQGSPPRVRGKGLERFEPLRCVGITPAYAGKSSTATRAARSTGDHPHVCGEKLLAQLRTGSIEGSPPRMRGKVLGKAVLFDCHGITPAYAEKRTPQHTPRSATWDHPRVCGEKTTQTAPTPVSPISSMARWVTRVPGPSSSTEMPAAGI